ncbi:hypothetical protein [Streptomyces cavernae]|uniref:hypothetical protein n=1 Tax=Streptomyces cavernae TaxID=2259034 RepID=UPI001EE490F3|nr:hypothetical protein [Streptomyces cavernae]
MRPSPLPPYLARELKPQDLNLRDGEKPMIVCPECGTWRFLKRSMIQAHHPGQEDLKKGERAPRCLGSARLVDFSGLTVEEWGAALVEGDLEAGARRSKQQFSKPTPPSGQAVHRLPRTTQTPLERARQAIARHQVDCKICSGGKKCRMTVLLAQREAGRAGLAALERALRAVARHRVGCDDCRRGEFCPLGYELAERRVWTEETRADVVQKQIREQQEEQSWERGRDRRHARRRARDWRRLESDVRRTDRARAQRPVGTDSPNDHTSVPLEPIHVSC